MLQCSAYKDLRHFCSRMGRFELIPKIWSFYGLLCGSNRFFGSRRGRFELIQNFVILWASVVVTNFLEVEGGVLNKYKI